MSGFRLSLLFLLLCSELLSQRLGQNGYVVTLTGDSLTGTVWQTDRVQMTREVLFTPNGSVWESAIRYPASSVTAFGYGDHTRFEQVQVPILGSSGVPYPGQMEFRLALLQERGLLWCYELPDAGQPRTVIRDSSRLYIFDLHRSEALPCQRKGNRLEVTGTRVTLPFVAGSEGLIRSDVDGQWYLWEQDSLYRVYDQRLGLLRSLTADCPEVDLTRVEETGHSLVRSVVRQYNNCRIRRGQSFKREADWQPALLLGVSWNAFLQNGFNQGFLPVLSAEIRRNDWSPRISLRYGLGYMQGEPVEYEDSGNALPPLLSVFVHDLALQYHFRPGRNFRPFFGVGLVRYDLQPLRPDGVTLNPIQLQRVSGGFPLFSLGLDYYLNNWQFRAIMESRGGICFGIQAGVWF